MRNHWLISGLLALTTGCVQLPGASHTTKPRATTSASPAVTEAQATPAATPAPSRVVTQLAGASSSLSTLQITGGVGIISEHGSGVISNNAGNLISDGGGGIIANNGGGLIANNAGNLTGKTKLTLLDVTPEAALADARIEIFDASGHRLVDEQNHPLGAVSDAKGHFVLKAALPNEPLILQIQLFPNAGVDRGQLFALLVQDPSTKTRTLDISTASSLGAAYVLDKYVLGRTEVLAKLPLTDASALQQDLDVARQALAGVPSYKRADQVKAVEQLRAKAGTLDTTLKRIEAILLAGQANFGDGLSATAVSLGQPISLALDANGDLFIGEATPGRVRTVSMSKPGTPIRVTVGSASSGLLGDGGPARAASLGEATTLLRDSDGALLIADALQHRVRRVAPDGTITTLVGTGDSAPGPLGQATQTNVGRVSSLLRLPSGDLLVGEAPEHATDVGRLLRIKPDGSVSKEDLTPVDAGGCGLVALALTNDGTVFALDHNLKRLLKRTPAGVWSEMLTALTLGHSSGLLAAPGGGVYLSESGANRVWLVKADGNKAVVAGTGEAGSSGDGGPAAQAELNSPAGMALAADGTLYVADASNNFVRAIAPDGDRKIRTVAGTSGASQVGDATSIAMNAPSGLAEDAQGRLLISESIGNDIKRLENGALSVVVGTQRGFAGDGGPATSAKLAAPGGIAFQGDNLIIADGSNFRIRRVDAQGVITTLVTQGPNAPDPTLTRYPASAVPMKGLTVVAVSPSGTIYWTDTKFCQIWRLAPDGMAEIVAGSPAGKPGDAGDGGPAAQALLDTPFGLAFDAQRRLYVTDLGNMRIRRIDLNDPTAPITTVAGLPRLDTLAQLLQGNVSAATAPATQVPLALPGPITIDKVGNVYVGEFGTAHFDSLSDLRGPAFASLPKVPSRVRKLGLDGRMSVIAGPGSTLLTDSLGAAGGLLVDAKGRLVITDIANNQLQLLPAGSF